MVCLRRACMQLWIFFFCSLGQHLFLRPPIYRKQTMLLPRPPGSTRFLDSAAVRHSTILSLLRCISLANRVIPVSFISGMMFGLFVFFVLFTHGSPCDSSPDGQHSLGRIFCGQETRPCNPHPLRPHPLFLCQCLGHGPTSSSLRPLRLDGQGERGQAHGRITVQHNAPRKGLAARAHLFWFLFFCFQGLVQKTGRESRPPLPHAKPMKYYEDKIHRFAIQTKVCYSNKI